MILVLIMCWSSVAAGFFSDDHRTAHVKLVGAKVTVLFSFVCLLLLSVSL